MNTIFILLGSNKGYRYQHLLLAHYFISQNIGKIVASSNIYETAPWKVNHKTKYLNQCIKIESSLSIFQLFNATRKIEKILGRTNKNQQSSRTIDIDILFYNEIVLQAKNLQIPHPRLHLRNFTLVPLNEIAKQYVHPILCTTIEVLVNQCDDESTIEIYEK